MLIGRENIYATQDPRTHSLSLEIICHVNEEGDCSMCSIYTYMYMYVRIPHYTLMFINIYY